MIIFTFINSCFAESIVQVEKKTQDFYVNDFTNIFTQEQKHEMMDRAIELNDTYNGVQVVVSTIESLEGENAKDYADSMFKQYEIGNNSMGVLVLVSEKDKEAEVVIGEKLQKTIANSSTNKIESSVLKHYFKTDDLKEATVLAQSEIIDEIKENVSADWQEKERFSTKSMLITFTTIFGLGTIFIIWILALDKKN